MPIIIRNIVVTANITEGKPKSTTAAATATQGAASVINEETRLQIIEEAVQQVMDILERQKER